MLGHSSIVTPKFAKSAGELTMHNFYTLRVCKNCRADWIEAIADWFVNIAAPRESCGSGIFVRHYGTSVEVTPAEWERLNPGRVPVIYKKGE
jgi:hypothetical protein